MFKLSRRRKSQLLLALFAVLAAVCTPRVALAASKLSISATQSPTIGKIIAATSGTSVFNFSTSGSVSYVSGSGVRPVQAGGAAAGVVTITCRSSSCNSKAVTISITAGGVSGRGGVLGNFTAVAGSVSGGPASSLTLTLPNGLGGKGTTTSTLDVAIGANFPIAGDDASGASSASSIINVSVSDNGGDSASTSLTAGATVQHGLSISTTALSFGRIVSSKTGGTVSYPAGSGVLTLPADSKELGTPSLGSATATGETGAVVSISVSSAAMTSGSTTLTVTPSISPAGAQLLVANGHGTGSKTFTIGGSFTLPPGVASGTYSGTLTVTAQYN